ncbi:hypothetical protein TNCV_782931 [Trichonephila clavipes]|nr:hypothetical protein TNCV_782931 [Trichonephila clavipes]
MPDGIPAHFSIAGLNPLHAIYPVRWAEHGGSVARPPLSLDLNSLDFFFWNHLKWLVYETTEEELTLRISPQHLKSPAHWICLNVFYNPSSISVGYVMTNARVHDVQIDKKKALDRYKAVNDSLGNLSTALLEKFKSSGLILKSLWLLNCWAAEDMLWRKLNIRAVWAMRAGSLFCDDFVNGLDDFVNGLDVFVNGLDDFVADLALTLLDDLLLGS